MQHQCPNIRVTLSMSPYLLDAVPLPPTRGICCTCVIAMGVRDNTWVRGGELASTYGAVRAVCFGVAAMMGTEGWVCSGRRGCAGYPPHVFPSSLSQK